MSDAGPQIFQPCEVCAVIPTYCNAGTLSDIVLRVSRFIPDIIVVNDGSNDSTLQVLEECSARVAGLSVISYGRNMGKGHALRTGLVEAGRRGFRYALTIDSDGQHYPEDIPVFLKETGHSPDTLVTGVRTLDRTAVSGGSRFANSFSNFWFRLQTGVALGDTQCGYRMYPLRRLRGLGLITSRYEAELELLVFSAWAGVRIAGVPVRVYYPPAQERISHFRPVYDFVRISILNVVLCAGALLYGWPVKLLRMLTGKG